MYAAGIPLGLLVDSKGPRLGSLIGAIALGLGYFLLHQGARIAPCDWSQTTNVLPAYVSGPGLMSLPILFFFSFLTGLGSFSAFSASIKTGMARMISDTIFFLLMIWM